MPRSKPHYLKARHTLPLSEVKRLSDAGQRAVADQIARGVLVVASVGPPGRQQQCIMLASEAPK
jgi:hypothetical protein